MHGHPLAERRRPMKGLCVKRDWSQTDWGRKWRWSETKPVERGKKVSHPTLMANQGADAIYQIIIWESNGRSIIEWEEWVREGCAEALWWALHNFSWKKPSADCFIIMDSLGQTRPKLPYCKGGLRHLIDGVREQDMTQLILGSQATEQVLMGERWNTLRLLTCDAANAVYIIYRWPFWHRSMENLRRLMPASIAQLVRAPLSYMYDALNNVSKAGVTSSSLVGGTYFFN